MIPPRRTSTASVEVEDNDSPKADRTKSGDSSTMDGDGPAAERVRISDDTGGSMPTHGSAIPKPSAGLRGGLDDYGSELARDARIWPAYVKEAEKWDEDMVDGWNRSLDVILVFAALFSAISTAFVIESAKNLKQDPAENAAASMLVAVSMLRAIAEGQAVNSTSKGDGKLAEFTPPFAAVCVNTLWFLSLSLGVSVSLVAMLAKQWCYSYMSGRTGQPHVQARRRQRRLDGLERWKMAEILAFLPTLMHCSLSLTIYLWNIHTTVAIPVLVITALTVVFYAATTILPVGNAYCPYSTPLSRHIEATLRKFLAPFEHTPFVRPLFSRQHEIDTSEESSSLSDDLTSRALSWLITNSQDARSVDLALQAIAGADSGMPVQPLVQRGIVSRLVGRFMGCFTVHPKTGYTCLGRESFSEAASLYGRALAFVVSNASDRAAVAMELRVASGTAQYKKVWSIDRGYSCLEEQFILKNPNISAFGAADMSKWREFWARVEWPWPNTPLTRTSTILERHLKGEITLHPTAILTLVETMGLEASRWLDPRNPGDRGRVAMCLVKLLAQSVQHPQDPTRSAVAVTLAIFTLAVDDYSGGASKPSPGSRANRAMEVLRLYSSQRARPEEYENLLVFGLLGLLRHMEDYALSSVDIITTASSLGLAYRMDNGRTSLPFLPNSFNTEKYLLEIVLPHLRPLANFGHFTVDEAARSALLGLLTLQPHTWARHDQLYEVIAQTLDLAETQRLQMSCLAAIGSQWGRAPAIYLLKTWFGHGTFKVILKLISGRGSARVAFVAMHPLWMMVSETLGLTLSENAAEKSTFFDAESVLRSAVDEGLFFVLAGSFSKVIDPAVARSHVDMWVWVFEKLGQTFSREIVESNVLLAMADFYDSNIVGETISSITSNGTGTSSPRRNKGLQVQAYKLSRPRELSSPVLVGPIMRFLGLSGVLVCSFAAVNSSVLSDRGGVADVIANIITAEQQWHKEFVNTSYVLSGDSTTANGTIPNSGGWGNGFCASLVPGTPCINRAKNGATTTSFRADGSWNLTLESAKGEVANGRKTWVTIQFGHNDMKVMTPEAMGANLGKFIGEIRGVGAEPILITSLTRRNFNADNETLNDTLGPWVNETILISQEKQTHLLDLHKWSMWYVEKIGPDAAHRLNRLPDDNTHLNANGTTVFGRMVADLMAVNLVLDIGPILPNVSLSLKIWTGQAIY